MKVNDKGYQALWLWFGLSYAGFLTLPRVLMHEMPDDWQMKMADLLQEYEDTFCKFPNDMPQPYVVGRCKGKFAKWQQWLLDYRHPNKNEIAKLKG